MAYYYIDGKKKHYKSIKTARAKGLKYCYDSWSNSLEIYNDDGSIDGEIEFDFDYKSSYAYMGWDKNGKAFRRPLYKDGSIGPNKYAKRK